MLINEKKMHNFGNYSRKIVRNWFDNDLLELSTSKSN